MSQEVEQHILLKYELLKKVGSGAYGHVWKAVDRKTKALVALKKIFDAFQHSTDAQRTFREITLLHEMNHSNIIKLHNVFRAENDKDIYLVFEFMEADLHSVVSQRVLQDIHNKFVIYQICKALKYLHSADLIHRDLKPSNILLNSDCKVKVCDFGLVRCIANDNEAEDLVLTEEVATRWYRAPEVLLGSRSYDRPADMWSVGCIIAQMLVFKPVFPGNSTMNQLERILSYTGRPSAQDVAALDSDLAGTMISSIKNIKHKTLSEWFNPSVSESAIDLVSKLLHFNPAKRLTAQQALKHPYLSEFYNRKDEEVSQGPIRPPIDDNKKLSLRQYRTILYDYVKRTYRDEQLVRTDVQPKSQSKQRHRRSTPNVNQPNCSRPKTPQGQILSKFKNGGMSCKQLVREKDVGMRDLNERRNSRHFPVKTQGQLGKPSTQYRSTYVRQFSSTHPLKENSMKRY